MIWHRPLVDEDVATAHRLIAQHQPADRYQRDPYCANAGHWGTAPAWPCQRARWAQEVLAAEARGEISTEPPQIAIAAAGVAPTENHLRGVA